MMLNRNESAILRECVPRFASAVDVRMSLIDQILNFAVLLLWLNWRAHVLILWTARARRASSALCDRPTPPAVQRLAIPGGGGFAFGCPRVRFIGRSGRRRSGRPRLNLMFVALAFRSDNFRPLPSLFRP